MSFLDIHLLGVPIFTSNESKPSEAIYTSSSGETKHGGSKNGKKEGLSGSSFFTWFMVIALLGVWTSVAVVWFELVDYEEVLGKNFIS
uniref:Aspartyl beta-hydroxylase/Triadin domain-containing protein n=1 Tax=Dromaius novaehollandiae TaxID=8790 RepID=A0A8C4P2P8_DRONO